MKQEYLTQQNLQQLNVKVTLIRIVDENLVLKKEMRDNLEVMFNLELYNNYQLIIPVKQTRILKKQQYDQDIIFNNRYKDLSFNAFIAFTLWSSQLPNNQSMPLGCTTVTLYDQDFKLRQGKYNLIIYPNKHPDCSPKNATPGIVEINQVQELNFISQKLEEIEQLNDNIVSSDNDNKILETLRNKQLYQYKKIAGAFLEVEFTKFPFPVLYENIEIENEEYQDPLLFSFLNSNWQDPLKNYLIQQQAQNPFAFSTFQELEMIKDFDYEYGRNDVLQDLFFKVLRNNKNPQSMKPSKQELTKINQCIIKPNIFKIDDKMKYMIWLYRYDLKNNFKALPKFIQCVDWSKQNEQIEALKLIDQWASFDSNDLTNLEVPLYLLSGAFSANEKYQKQAILKWQNNAEEIKKIRSYAISILQQASLEQIQLILLQLVHSFRYESIEEVWFTSIDQLEDWQLPKFLIQKVHSNIQLASYFFWFVKTECDNGKIKKQKKKLKDKSICSWYSNIFKLYENYLKEIHMTQFNQISLNQSFFENEEEGEEEEGSSSNDEHDEQQIQKLQRTRMKNMSSISKNNSILTKSIYDQIQDQIQLKQIIDELFLKSHKIKDSSKKKEELIKLISTGDYNFPIQKFCLNTHIEVCQFIPNDFMYFKSNVNPMRIGFSTTQNLEEIIDCKQKQKIKEFSYKVIYKKGDDLRQDQLIIQIFALLNTILQNYIVMATSKDDGFVEFVDNSWDLQEILYNQKMSVQGYFDYLLKKYYSNDSSMTKEKILNNYVNSCAGYAVITYFLGIGDRHLQNIMIGSKGNFFHIDFGFILGKDPKPYPPPLKLCKEMVEGMGGRNSKDYDSFRLKARDAYNYLRKYGTLIITMFQIMIDSGIKDITQEALEKMYDKFLMDENDEVAEKHFLEIIDKSIEALLPDISDKIHKWVAYWKK